MLLIAALVAATAALTPAPRTAIEAGGFEIAQIIVRSHIVVKIEAQRGAMPPAFMTLKEKKGPKCIPRTDLIGAAVLASNSVDFIVRGGARLRAKFSNSCPALDFFASFYLTPNEDGQICAGRDIIHSRAGGECQIERFRLMIPAAVK